MSERVSNEELEKAIIDQSGYFGSFVAGIDCIGGAQAKWDLDAFLDLRDIRGEREERTQERDAALLHVGKLNNEVNAARAQVAMLRCSLAETRRELESAPGGLRKQMKAATLRGAADAMSATEADNAAWLEQHDAQVRREMVPELARKINEPDPDFDAWEKEEVNKLRREAAEEMRERCAMAAEAHEGNHGEHRAPTFRAGQFSEMEEEFLTTGWNHGQSLGACFHDAYDAGKADAAAAIRALPTAPGEQGLKGDAVTRPDPQPFSAEEWKRHADTMWRFQTSGLDWPVEIQQRVVATIREANLKLLSWEADCIESLLARCERLGNELSAYKADEDVARGEW